MMGMDRELRQIKYEMESKGHIGFCFGDYSATACWNCPCLDECIKLYLREKERE